LTGLFFLFIFTAIVVMAVEEKILEGFDVFKQFLEALVPLGGGLMQEDNALMHKA
jgi:hypothetical protein